MTTPKIGLSRLAESIPASFSSFYLSLISMIQGVALGLLATKLPDSLRSFRLMELAYACLTFVVIVIIWHEYVLAAQEFWWEITWMDSLVPFLLGIGEYLMIEFLGTGPHYASWFLAAAFTGFAGFLAYINYELWVKEEDFETKAAFLLFKRHVKQGRWLFLFLAGTNSASGVFLRYSFGRLQLLLLALAFGTSLALMVSMRLRWHRRALIAYGWRK